MTFAERLNQYMEDYACSTRELAEASGLSHTAIRRYRTGERIPDVDSDAFTGLCGGLAEVSGEAGISPEQIREELISTIPGASYDFALSVERLKALLAALDIRNVDLARALSFDPSTVSRVLAGQYRPKNSENLLLRASDFLAGRAMAAGAAATVQELTGCDRQVFYSEDRCAAAIFGWLTEGQAEIPADPAGNLLQKLNDFDLNDYIRAIRFDQLKVPTAPFQLPTSHTATGLRDMMETELNFLKVTALSRSGEPVLIYSDMPMESMARDPEFPKKWMFGMAAMLKKGLRLTMIHNVDRPFREMMLGLEAYIPMYMTGQISPYYLKDTNSGPFRHLLEVSGAAALSGEAIAGHHGSGRYYLTKSREEVRYYRRRADELLQNARPLMDIYRSDSEQRFREFLRQEFHRPGSRRMILSSPPLFTIPETLLDRMIGHNGLTEGDRERIREYARFQKKLFASAPADSSLVVEVPELSPEQFHGDPLKLSLAGMFFEADVQYTYEEYREHLQATLDARSDAVTVKLRAFQPFRNIQIFVQHGSWAIVSKSKAPAIHFVMQHPKLVDAIEHFVPPMVEQEG